VIERQPPAVREFLLQTSILERLSAPLCDAVTGRENSQGTLLALEQGNLFVVPLDESRQWYRYHGLFAELLRHRLRTEAGWEIIKVLHERARRWYGEYGSAEEAIRHALAAQDWEQAATLIQAESSTMLNRGEISTLLRWMRSLPDDIIRASPQLCCSYAWPLVISGQIEAGKSYLQIAEEAAPADLTLQPHIAAARVHIARAQGDMQGVVQWSERALSLLPRDDLSARAVVAVGLGMGHWYLGHVNKAEEAFSETELAAQQSRNVHAATFAQTFLGRIKACRGKLHRAILHYQQGIEFGAEQPAAGMCYMDRGTIRYEWNDLDGAVDDLKRGIDVSQRGGSPDITVYGHAQLALTRLAQRDTENALAALEEARRGADRIDPGAVIHPNWPPTRFRRRWHWETWIRRCGGHSVWVTGPTLPPSIPGSASPASVCCLPRARRQRPPSAQKPHMASPAGLAGTMVRSGRARCRRWLRQSLSKAWPTLRMRFLRLSPRVTRASSSTRASR